MNIFVIALIVFVSSFIFSLGIGSFATDRGRIKRFKERALAGQGTAQEQELARPFSDRAVAPFVRAVSAVARKMSPGGVLAGIRRRLILAGKPRSLDVDSLLALKGVSAAAGGGLAVVLSAVSMSFSGRTAWLTAAAVVLAFFAPDLWLHGKIIKRQKAIRQALPDMLDLLVISVEAGLGFDAALSKVVGNTTGPLSNEFFRMLQEIQLGTSRSQAFRNLGERTGVSELDSFIIAMLQADIFGISIGKVLRVQAQEMRVKRRQLAEEIAQKAPVKIVFPLILCIFPALLVVILGPAAINIYRALSGGF